MSPDAMGLGRILGLAAGGWKTLFGLPDRCLSCELFNH